MGSLAVNVGSLHHHRNSDTEGDFLDRDEIDKSALLKRLNQKQPADDEYKSNMADDEFSLCSDMETHRDKKTVKVIQPLRYNLKRVCLFILPPPHFYPPLLIQCKVPPIELYDGCFTVYSMIQRILLLPNLNARQFALGHK